MALMASAPIFAMAAWMDFWSASRPVRKPLEAIFPASYMASAMVLP